MAINETPPFWFSKPGVKSWILWPFSLIYNKASSANMLAAASGSVDVPVLCVGNFVVGGGGKTPTVIALVKYAKENGFKPGVLSRGYGGKVTTATQVNLEKHLAKDVGDEPLLLAQHAITIVSADRLVGAKLLVDLGCNVIIMDDGFQNPKLEKDYCLIVVDSKRGIGNGFAMPAGPLRVSMGAQFQKTDSVLIIGEEQGADNLVRLAARAAKPIYNANTSIVNKARWKNKSVLPYSGIADPNKFFDNLRDAGAQIAQLTKFGDHHFYTKDDAKELLDKSKLMGAQLVTTAKDWVRLQGMGNLQQILADNSEVVELGFEFEDNTTPKLIFQKMMKRFDKRILSKISD